MTEPASPGLCRDRNREASRTDSEQVVTSAPARATLAPRPDALERLRSHLANDASGFSSAFSEDEVRT